MEVVDFVVVVVIVVVVYHKVDNNMVGMVVVEDNYQTLDMDNQLGKMVDDT